MSPFWKPTLAAVPVYLWALPEDVEPLKNAIVRPFMKHEIATDFARAQLFFDLCVLFGGDGITAAYAFEWGLRQRIAVEYTWLDSKRPASSPTERSHDGWQLSYRFRY